jgi:hypothetical protein
MRSTALVGSALVLFTATVGYVPADDKDDDAKKIQGTWVVDPTTFKGVEDKKVLKEVLKEAESMRFIFAGDTCTMKHPLGTRRRAAFAWTRRRTRSRST